MVISISLTSRSAGGPRPKAPSQRRRASEEEKLRPPNDPRKHARKRRPRRHRNLRSLQPQSRRQRRRPAGKYDRASDSSTPALQPMRRKTNQHQTRMAHRAPTAVAPVPRLPQAARSRVKMLLLDLIRRAATSATSPVSHHAASAFRRTRQPA